MEIVAMIDGGNGDIEIGMMDGNSLVVRPHSDINESPWENLPGQPKFAGRHEALKYLEDSYSSGDWNLRWMI